MSFLHYEDGVLDPSSIIPLIDGGTEGFKGNVRVIIPGMTACVERTLALYPPQVIQPVNSFVFHIPLICWFLFLVLCLEYHGFFWFSSPAQPGQFSHVHHCIHAQTARALH